MEFAFNAYSVIRTASEMEATDSDSDSVVSFDRPLSDHDAISDNELQAQGVEQDQPAQSEQYIHQMRDEFRDSLKSMVKDAMQDVVQSVVANMNENAAQHASVAPIVGSRGRSEAFTGPPRSDRRHVRRSSSSDSCASAEESHTRRSAIKRKAKQNQSVKIPPFNGKDDWRVWISRFEVIAQRQDWMMRKTWIISFLNCKETQGSLFSPNFEGMSSVIIDS